MITEIAKLIKYIDIEVVMCILLGIADLLEFILIIEEIRRDKK